ncbi:MAG: phospholipase D-like domain-containing protein [Verrucomicrobia bacterium]|nr:phospholipase D-like domain-containing protein [Verrucomicrobiota bacterium]
MSVPVSRAPNSRLTTMQAGYSEHRGCSVRLLRNGDQIFPAMLDAINAAQHSIFLETFIYWSGAVGERFADALATKARAGLDVRIILDWVGCLEMDDRLTERMRAAGVQVLHFRPLRWFSLRRFNHRTHRKLMVTDGSTGFIGGVGIADSWDGDAQDPEHWRDNHYLTTGPVVHDLQNLFLKHWDSDQPPPSPSPDPSPAVELKTGGRSHPFPVFRF